MVFSGRIIVKLFPLIEQKVFCDSNRVESNRFSLRKLIKEIINQEERFVFPKRRKLMEINNLSGQLNYTTKKRGLYIAVSFLCFVTSCTLAKGVSNTLFTAGVQHCTDDSENYHHLTYINMHSTSHFNFSQLFM